MDWPTAESIEVTPPIRLLIVDGLMIMRLGLVEALSAAPDIHVVAEAESGEEALFMCSKHAPNVVLMDSCMGGMGSHAAMKAIRDFYPAVAVIAFSTRDDAAAARELLLAGAICCLAKSTRPAVLIDTVRQVHAGERVIGLLAAASEAVAASRDDAANLAPQQQRVLNLVARGCTNAEIADLLAISERTVRHHVSALLVKLGAANRTEAVAVALRDGLLADGG